MMDDETCHLPLLEHDAVPSSPSERNHANERNDTHFESVVVKEVCHLPTTKCTTCGKDHASRTESSNGDDNPAPQPVSSYRFNCVAFSPHGTLLASGTHAGKLLLHCALCLQLLHESEDRLYEQLVCLAFSRSGAYLALGCVGGKIKVQSMRSPSYDMLYTTERCTATAIEQLAFSPIDETLLGSRTTESLLHLHRLPPPSSSTPSDDGTPEHIESRLLLRTATSFTFSPDGKTMVVGTEDMLELFSCCGGNSGKRIAEIAGGDYVKYPKSLVYSPTGNQIAFTSRGTVNVLDATSGALIHSLCVAKGFKSVCFSPDGSMLAAGAKNKALLVYDTLSGDVLYSFSSHTNYIVPSVAFSPDGTTLASCGWERAAAVQLHRIIAPQHSHVVPPSLPALSHQAFEEFKRTIPSDITEDEAAAAFRAAECGAEYAFPRWNTKQQRVVASPVNEMHAGGELFRLFASKVEQYTLPRASTMALYTVWRMKHPDWGTLSSKTAAAIGKSIVAVCEKRLQRVQVTTPDDGADKTTTSALKAQFTRWVESPHSLRFRDSASKDRMVQSWMAFCDQAPGTESVDAKVEGFVRRVRKDGDGNATFDERALPVYWAHYGKAEEVAVAEAVRDGQALENRGQVTGLYNWFRHWMGRRGLSRTTITKMYVSWKLLLVEKRLEKERDERTLLPVLEAFAADLGLGAKRMGLPV